MGMITKFDTIDLTKGAGKAELVKWSDKYYTGVELVDTQHRELVNLTNKLYEACLVRSDELGGVFKDAMSRMVDYVRFHFSAEQKLLERIKYPEYPTHKKQHEELVIDILAVAKEYNEGRHLVPNKFARTLQEWIFSHIAIYDQMWAAYVNEQKRKGLLTDEMINSQ